MIAATIACFSLMADSGNAQQPSAVSETYGSWTFQCRTETPPDGSKARKTCQVSQEIEQTETGNRILSTAYTASPAKLTFVTPFGLRLSEGVDVSSEKHEFQTGVFTTCLASLGCIAELELGEKDSAELLSSETLTVVMVSVSGQKFQLKLSLDGFQGAHARLIRSTQ